MMNFPGNGSFITQTKSSLLLSFLSTTSESKKINQSIKQSRKEIDPNSKRRKRDG